MGSKNHEVVPTELIVNLSQLKHGSVRTILRELTKNKLVSREANVKYDGYRLTYGGYDYLALRTLSKRDSVTSVGSQIGVGKESDVYIAANAEGKQGILKIHRLGRTSFRTIKTNRDYLAKRKHASWLYLSRLSASKEYAFMKALYDNGFPVPQPFDHNRHCISMELLNAHPLCQVSHLENPGKVYSDLMNLIVRLAKYGLIHGDFNEFNLLINDSSEVILIDFPQMVSTSHQNAEMYFNRDVQCIRTFFEKKFNYVSLVYPKFGLDSKKEFDLDIQVAASGFNPAMQNELESLKMLLLQEDLKEEECNLHEEESSEESNEESMEENENEERSEEENENDSSSENLSDELDNRSSSENENSSDIEIENLGLNENRTLKPFYDSASKVEPSFKNAEKVACHKVEKEQRLSREEIKNRVKKSLNKKEKTGTSNSRRNLTKTRTKQKIQHEGGFWD